MSYRWMRELSLLVVEPQLLVTKGLGASVCSAPGRFCMNQCPYGVNSEIVCTALLVSLGVNLRETHLRSPVGVP